MVGLAVVAEQECRSDSSDVGGQGPTDARLAEPREVGQSRQQNIPYAHSRGSLHATQALEDRGRLLHAPGEWTPPLVIPHQGIHHRSRPGEFLGQNDAINQSGIRSRAQVRGNGMGRVTEQDQAAGEPAPTVHLANGIDQQVVERRHPVQQVPRGG